MEEMLAELRHLVVYRGMTQRHVFKAKNYLTINAFSQVKKITIIVIPCLFL